MSGRLRPDVSALDHSLGPADAPVTLVEYGDYQCPYCAAAHPLLQRALRRMAGDVRFVFRNFPITESHPNAEHAAEAAEAAAERGRFWEMHDALFERREEWIHALEVGPIVRLAADLGLDPAEVRAAIDERTYDQRIRDDFASGLHSGVNGTPTFFVNGVRYDGAWDGDHLVRLIADARDAVAAH